MSARPKSLNDLRPINNFLVFSTVLERVLEEQIRKRLKTFKIISTLQSSFRLSLDRGTTLLKI